LILKGRELVCVVERCACLVYVVNTGVEVADEKSSLAEQAPLPMK